MFAQGRLFLQSPFFKLILQITRTSTTCSELSAILPLFEDALCDTGIQMASRDGPGEIATVFSNDGRRNSRRSEVRMRIAMGNNPGKLAIGLSRLVPRLD